MANFLSVVRYQSTTQALQRFITQEQYDALEPEARGLYRSELEMSLDPQATRLTKFGTITVSEDRISVSGFDGVNATCRDVVVQSLIWAMGRIQREILIAIEEPGISKVAID